MNATALEALKAERERIAVELQQLAERNFEVRQGLDLNLKREEMLRQRVYDLDEALMDAVTA